MPYRPSWRTSSSRWSTTSTKPELAYRNRRSWSSAAQQLKQWSTRTKPTLTYWPTLRAAEYDSAVSARRTRDAVPVAISDAPNARTADSGDSRCQWRAVQSLLVRMRSALGSSQSTFSRQALLRDLMLAPIGRCTFLVAVTGQPKNCQQGATAGRTPNFAPSACHLRQVMPTSCAAADAKFCA